MGKGSDQFRLDAASGRVYLAENGKNLDHEEEEKLYLRLRATDAVGHITESQVINIRFYRRRSLCCVRNFMNIIYLHYCTTIFCSS